MRYILTSLFAFAFIYAQGSTKVRLGILDALQSKISISTDLNNSNTLLFTQAPQSFSLKEVLEKKTFFNQNIANYINQIYYSTKISFDFSQRFYLQSAKVFRQINIQRSSKRDEGERVRLIFVGFEY